MAKSKKNGHVTPDVEPDVVETLQDGDVVEHRQELTSEQLRALFDDWKEADRELESIKAQIDAAGAKRSECVRAIVEALGNKGPWTIDGVRLSVSVRGDKYNMQRESDAKLVL